MDDPGGTSPTDGNLSGEDRRKHLDFIQTVIGRMFSASTLAKGWCLTVATATFGYALTKKSVAVAALGIFAALLFGLMDSRYLREERKFRALYEDARLGKVATYEMRVERYCNKKSSSLALNCTWPEVVKSWSIWAFYGPILIVGILTLLRACISR